MKHHRVRETAHGVDFVAKPGCVTDDEEGVTITGVEMRAGVEVVRGGWYGAEWTVVG